MRFRHFRGARVHSPLVYGIVRGVLMPCVRQPVEEQIRALFDYLSHQSERGLFGGEALCIVSHRHNRRARRRVVELHDGTSFETRRFLCVMTNGRLPKQHFRL